MIDIFSYGTTFRLACCTMDMVYTPPICIQQRFNGWL